MSRTYRRRGQTHEYRWVLRDRSDATPWWAHALLDRHSREGPSRNSALSLGRRSHHAKRCTALVPPGFRPPSAHHE